MQEVIAEIVEVLKRHDINVELDSAMIETGPGGEVWTLLFIMALFGFNDYKLE